MKPTPILMLIVGILLCMPAIIVMGSVVLDAYLALYRISPAIVGIASGYLGAILIIVSAEMLRKDLSS